MADILGAEPVTLRRYASGSRGADGRWVPDATTDTTIRASVQPLTERELASLPEGERESDQRKVYTKSDLVVGRQEDSIQSDRLSWDGGDTWYEVRAAAKERSVLPHTKARVVRLAEGDA